MNKFFYYTLLSFSLITLSLNIAYSCDVTRNGIFKVRFENKPDLLAKTAFGINGFSDLISPNSKSCYKNISETTCYPFLKSSATVTEEKSVREFNASVEAQIFAMAKNADGCQENKLCFCSDTVDPNESDYTLQQSCQFSDMENLDVKECDLESNITSDKFNDFIQAVEGCNGSNRCYKLNASDAETLSITSLNLNHLVDGGQFTTEYINTLIQNNKGICLPTTKCVPRKLGAGMKMRLKDECQEPLVSIGELPDKFCADPSLAALSENLPHEIKFTLDPESCEIKGFEYDEQGQLIYQPYGLLESNDTSSGVAFVGEAESILKNSTDRETVVFYPDAKNLSEDERVKIISVTDYKNMTFSKILRGMEYLWGEANSNAISLNWLTGERKKLTLGKQAKASFLRYQVSRRLSEVIQTIESKKIFDLVQAEVDPEAEPLATIKAQIVALDVYKKLLHIELLGLRDLLGGKNFLDVVNSDSYTKHGDGPTYEEFHDKDANYVRSLAYIKNASNSIHRKLWDRRTNGDEHCPMFCWPLEDCSTDIQCGGECETGDDTLGMDWSGTDEGHKYLIRLCVEDVLKVKGHIQHGEHYNGSLVDAIYPTSITAGTSSKGVHKGTGRIFDSTQSLIDNIKNGLDTYSNKSMSTFSENQIELLQNLSEFDIAKSYIQEYNSFDDTQQLLYNVGELNNMITGEYSCAFGDNLKHVNLKFTAEEFLLRQKNEGSNNPISLLLKKKDIQDFKKSYVDDNDPKKLDKFLKSSSLDYLSKNIADIFIKMHFVRFQEQWRNEGSSGLLGGTSFWDDPSSKATFNSDAHYKEWGNLEGDEVGKTLGYVNELYEMVEYMYKYRAGLLDGFEKQVTCLNDKVESFEKELGDINEERISNASSENYAKIKEEAKGKVNETNEKIKQFITVQQRLAQLKNACGIEEIETTPGSSSSPDTPSGQVGNPEVSGFVDFQFDQQEGLGLGKGKKGFKKRTTPRKGKLGFGKLSFSGTGALESSAVGGGEGVSQAVTGTGNVSGGSGGKKAKRSAKDEVKKVISGLNKLNEGKKDLYSKVKNASTISTGNILASIFRPDTLGEGISSDLGKSLRSTDFNKKKKVSKKIKAAKTKIKKRRSKSFRTKRRNKKFRKKITPKQARRNAKILRAIKKNPKRYNTLEKDSLFTRISKAIVRHGYPIFLKETNFDTELPSSKRKLYNSKNNDKYLD